MATDPKQLDQQIRNLNEQLDIAEDNFQSIGKILSNDLKKSLSDLSNSTGDFINKFEKGQNIIASLNKKLNDVTKQSNKLSFERSDLEAKLSDAITNKNKGLQKSLSTELLQNKAANQQLELYQTVLVKLMQIAEQEQAATKEKEKQNQWQNKYPKLYKDTASALLPLTLLWKQILSFTLAADVQVTELAKSLGLSKNQAWGIRDNFASYAKSTGDTFVTTKKLMEAQSELTQELGVAVKYTGEQTEDFSRLTKLMGLSVGEAGKLARLSIINGTSIESTTKSIIKGSFASEQANKISVDQRTILKEVANLSEGILIKFQGNPEALGAAVVQAKALGLSLNEVDKIGESLLNWESSIENELKAELITGRQINLEKARAAALTGDQATLTAEIASQTGNLNDYQNMNVIAQKSLAEAFGMSRDEMSKMLMDQEKFNKLGDVSNMTLQQQLENLKAQGEPIDSVLYKQIQQQSIQEKFNNAIEKLQDIVGNLVAGPLGQMLDIFVGLANNATILYSVLGAIAGISLVKTIGSLALMAAELAASSISAITLSSAITFGLGTVAILAAIGGIVGYMSSATDKAVNNVPKFANGGIVTSEINNATVGEAGPEAIIPLNSPKAASMLGGGGNMDMVVKAIDRLNNRIDNAMNRPAIAYIQGENAFARNLGSNKTLGSSQVQNSYNLA